MTAGRVQRAPGGDADDPGGDARAPIEGTSAVERGKEDLLHDVLHVRIARPENARDAAMDAIDVVPVESAHGPFVAGRRIAEDTRVVVQPARDRTEWSAHHARHVLESLGWLAFSNRHGRTRMTSAPQSVTRSSTNTVSAGGQLMSGNRTGGRTKRAGEA